MTLEKYNKKRNFDTTNEPKGEKTKIRKKQTHLRFVVQYHQARAKHYDFRLEWNGVLLSWAVPKGLSLNPKVKRLAVQVEDHPIDYINFKGIIPKGNYGAGTVEIFDKGNYICLDDMEKSLNKGHIKIVLNGEKLKGGFSLVRMDDKNWIIVKTDDEFSQRKEQKKIVNKNPFHKTNVQLATLCKKIPNDKGWLYEIKYDGYRILSFYENKKVVLYSRNHKDYTSKFINIAKSLTSMKQDAFVLDGEVVVFDELGRSNFGLLQENIRKKTNNFYYIIFDILALNGEDLRDLPLIERKEKLKLVLANVNDCLIFSNYLIDKGEESFDFAKEQNLEGIIAKKINSKYFGKRTDDWLKIKCYKRQEFVICGYTVSEKNEYLSAILLGYYNKTKITYVGKVGTGFNEQQKVELFKKFQTLLVKDCPFDKNIKEKNIFWLKPKLVAEIQYAELTKDKLLRQPSFVGLRTDKEAKEVKLEEDIDN